MISSTAPAAPAPAVAAPAPARTRIVVSDGALAQARALRPGVVDDDDGMRAFLVCMVQVAALGGKVETGETQLFAPLGCPRWGWAVIEGTAEGTAVVSSVVASLRAPPAPRCASDSSRYPASVNTSTPILDAFDDALAQFRGTPAAQLGGRIRWTGTPEQVQALQSEIMSTPGGTFPAPVTAAPVTAAGDGPVYCGMFLNVDLYAHPLGGGFSIDAEPVLAHPVSPVLISGRPPRPAPATPAASDLHDLAADVRATIADLLEAAREAGSPDEKALMADAAAKLLAEIKCAAASDAACRPVRRWP